MSAGIVCTRVEPYKNMRTCVFSYGSQTMVVIIAVAHAGGWAPGPTGLKRPQEIRKIRDNSDTVQWC